MRLLVLLLALAMGLIPVTASPAAAQAESCEARSTDGPVIVTATCLDPELSEPYTDKDEQRSITDPATGVEVRYRYIHGGFTGTKARFSLYFPPKSTYRGLFIESTYPTVDREDAERGTIAFAISNGAYVVSTNNGGGVAVAPVLGGYRVNAASAKYSREVAARIYKTPARPRGYLYGASGGAYQTISAMESTTGVWDGAVPMVPGVPNAIPSFMTVQLLGLRVLHDKLPQIVDAVEPGGSGDPYADLDVEQQAVLREVTRLGFPLRGWWQYATLTGGAFAAVEGGVKAFDGTYVDDFWALPGYEGSDPTAPLRAERIQHDATVVRVAGRRTKRLVLSSMPKGSLNGADLVLTSGADAGKAVVVGTVKGKTVSIAQGSDPAATRAIAAGDEVRIDNSWLLALEYYQRHQVPSSDQYGWNQYRDAQGAPTYPQRSVLVGPTFARISGGSVPNGRFDGKMIMLASVMDVQAFPWSADWYRSRAQAALGEQLDDRYRLWLMDNADHDPRGPKSTRAKHAAAHIVGYEGELHQALLDLDAWILRGAPPPASTAYEIDAENQLELPAAATERKGVQPVVDLAVTKIGTKTTSASERVEVATGRRATFTVKAEAPPGGGKIVRVEWDFAGVGKFPIRTSVSNPRREVQVRATHIFSEPGTYFPTARVTSRRDGQREARYMEIQNLGRVRVVVR
jgi:hypothetical protein